VTTSLEMSLADAHRRLRVRRQRTAIALAAVAVLTAACGGGGSVTPGVFSARTLPPPERQHVLALARHYSKCMQTPDVPNFPEPTTDPNGGADIIARPISTPRSTSAPRRRANGSTPSFLSGVRGPVIGLPDDCSQASGDRTNSRLIPLGLVDPFLVLLRTKTHGCATSRNRFERRQGRALDWLYTTNLNPLVEGPALVLAPVHGKVERVDTAKVAAVW
jgi:hypothetical protein